MNVPQKGTISKGSFIFQPSFLRGSMLLLRGVFFLDCGFSSGVPLQMFIFPFPVLGYPGQSLQHCTAFVEWWYFLIPSISVTKEIKKKKTSKTSHLSDLIPRLFLPHLQLLVTRHPHYLLPALPTKSQGRPDFG